MTEKYDFWSAINEINKLRTELHRLQGEINKVENILHEIEFDRYGFCPECGECESHSDTCILDQWLKNDI